MRAVRATVDMVAVFRPGEIPEPVKFRYYDGGIPHTVRVGKVLDIRKATCGNTRNYFYTCKSIIDRRERVYELRYIGPDVRWELYKI